ncbi:venom peptide HsVx1-like [Thrips palmi]|uniref:Venom peptide HsVx1-like n=1 Tax=Thrips palmi TaxID=161013 RepID=A0A6P8YV69_THRPL|nr:venom peptide HsVx1-like [Thrips palmi]
MSNTTAVVVLALAALLVTCGARQTAVQPAAETVVGCEVDGHHFGVGEVFNTGPESCNTYTCHDHGAVGALTCGYFSAGEGCEIVPGRSDPDAVYPHCCPSEMCNDNIINVD